MQGSGLALAIITFVAVAGYAGLAWWRGRAAASYLDDSSILLGAPPPGMTAATATIVSGGPTHLAFMTALLDLASRDEIAFEEEGTSGGLADVGIAIHGGPSADPRVLLNRRRPAGEGEAWLLGQLTIAAEMPAGLGHAGRLPASDQLSTYTAMLGSVLRASSLAPRDDESASAIAAREQGLLSGGPPDLAKLAELYEARTGHGVPEQFGQGLGAMGAILPLLSDPSAIARDPDAFAQVIERSSGHPLTPEQLGQLRQWAASHAASPAVAAHPRYIPADQARRLATPFLFGTFVESYARRHGWLGALPFLTRLRWHLLGTAEVIVGLVLLAAGSDLVSGLGIGTLGGGIATFLIAPLMVRTTAAGGQMRAQLAAYRRTLQLTFGSLRSLTDAVGPSGLTWLQTPDQALVWCMGLGLRADVEALLARTADDLRAGKGTPDAYVPVWYRAHAAPTSPAPSATGAAQEDSVEPDVVATAPTPVSPASPAVRMPIASPAAMFAGIEAIGKAAGH